MKKLQTLFELYTTAVFEKDLNTFISLYDEEVLVFDMWQQWSYAGLPAWKEMVSGWFAGLGSNRDVVTFNDTHMREENGLAVATAIVKFTAVSEKGEALRYLQNRLTWVIQKKDNDWKIIHQHTSSPIDFETMKAMLKK
jgi:uncharacterized protein (TIGR02246 family)